jgi:NACHT domain
MGLAEFVFGLITNLISSFIYTGYEDLDFFKRRKIKQRVEDATAGIVEPLLPFLTQEGISEDKQRRLIETCIEELRPLTQKPELLFQGSLNGQKIFDELYIERRLPQVIIEDDLKEVYTLICPRIATLLCKIPEAVKDWESEAWSESYRRFDEMISQLKTLFDVVDELATVATRDTDEILVRVRQVLSQKIRFELDLTGLRADRPIEGKFDDFFVHPQIKGKYETVSETNEPVLTIETSNTSFEFFTQRSQRAILIGQPGAGKSTWSKWFQREAFSQRWNGICVRVELRSLANKDLPSLHQIIRATAGQHLAEELTAERLSQWISSNRVVFILDGFDEIRPNDRDKAYDWIVDLNMALKKCPIILTSRPLTTDHLTRLSTWYKDWVVESFDHKRIVDYIERWYAHTPLLLADGNRQVNAENLASEWNRDPTIGPLTGNPLLLSTLLMVHHLDGSLPGGRSQLYERYVKGMLGLWDDRRDVVARELDLSLEKKRQIMQRFSLQMFLEGQEQLDESAAFELMKQILQGLNKSLAAEDVLEVLRERSGLIIGPGIYSFIHKSVAEYLVAESVVQGDQRDISGRRIDRFYLFENRDDDRWNTVTFLWAGLVPIADLESFIEECIGVNSFALAYGIIYDQYDRFFPEFRRSMLGRMTSQQLSDLTKAYNKSGHYVSFLCSISSKETSLKPSRNGFNIPTFELRKIGDFSGDFHALFFRAMKDKTITWNEHSSCFHGGLRDFLWINSVINPSNMDDWKTYLNSNYFPDNESEMYWLYMIAEFILRKYIYINDALSIKFIFNTYKTKYVYGSFLILESLIYNGFILIHAEEKISENIQNKPTNINHFKVITQILFDLYSSFKLDDIVKQEWLTATSKCITFPHFHNSQAISRIDLLRMFSENMQELLSEGSLVEDEAYECTLNLVCSLLRLRQKVV